MATTNDSTVDTKKTDVLAMQTYVNQGYCDEDLRKEKRIDQDLNASRLCKGNRVHVISPNICASSERELGTNNANGNRTPIEGIREYAIQELQREQSNDGKPTKTNQSNNTSRFLIFIAVVFVLAPFSVSAYVFWKHQQIVSSPCASHSVGPSVTSPSMQQSQTKYTEIKKQMDEVKDLHKKFHQLQIEARKSQRGSSLSEREARRSRGNSSDTNSKAYEASLDKLRKEFSMKAITIDRGCRRRIANLDIKINDIYSKLDESTSTGKCVFKMENNTEVDTVKNIRKSQITDQKNAVVQLVGVTCCGEYNTSNVSNAILEVNETTSNITYSCYCAKGLRCNLCYWQCGGD